MGISLQRCITISECVANESADSRNGEWYSCSDDEVTLVESATQRPRKRIRIDPDCEEGSSKDAYMLVYRQVGMEAAPSKPPDGIMSHIAADNVAAVLEKEQRAIDEVRYAQEFDELSDVRLEVMEDIVGVNTILDPLTTGRSDCPIISIDTLD